MASIEEGDDLGLGCKGDGFHGGGSWFERVVCPCLLHVELFNMSHNHSESLEGQSWDNARQDGGHSSLSCIGNKTVSMLSPQCGKHISANTDLGHVTNTSTER